MGSVARPGIPRRTKCSPRKRRKMSDVVALDRGFLGQRSDRRNSPRSLRSAHRLPATLHIAMKPSRRAPESALQERRDVGEPIEARHDAIGAIERDEPLASIPRQIETLIASSNENGSARLRDKGGGRWICRPHRRRASPLSFRFDLNRKDSRLRIGNSPSRRRCATRRNRRTSSRRSARNISCRRGSLH